MLLVTITPPSLQVSLTPTAPPSEPRGVGTLTLKKYYPNALSVKCVKLKVIPLGEKTTSLSNTQDQFVA